MTNEEWRTFFLTCSRVLGRGARQAHFSESWCAWTTFGALQETVHYWSSGIPAESEIGVVGTNDGGPAWGQPFLYHDIAHVVIPAKFYWEHQLNGEFEHGTKHQDLARLSQNLRSLGSTTD
jgi:hypothetical protein